MSWLSHRLFVPIKNRVNIYIIMAKKFVDEGSLEVEFHSQHSTPQRMPGTLVNDCIVTVQSPGKTKTQKEELFMSVPLCLFTFNWICILFPVNVLIYYKRSFVFEVFVKSCFLNYFFFLLDMPSGKVSLTLYNNESVVYSTTVTYFTEMEEICRYLEKATDPMQFMCQVMEKTIG